MRLRVALVISVFSALGACETCPFLGPVFPAPSELTKSTAFQAAREKLFSSIEKLMQTTNASEPTTINRADLSFTLQVFTGAYAQPVLEYYQTAEKIKNNTVGVSKVDENTVFRIASCSKVWTVLLLLIERGDAAFHEPVSKYIPELREFIAESKRNATIWHDAIDYLRWDEVTLGELASQMSGMERQYGLGDMAAQPDLMTPYGFPHLPQSEVPPCGFQPTCNRGQFFKGLRLRHPVFPTSATPAYSNDAFQLLGYALETMTGKSLHALLQEDIIGPLRLSHSSPTKPADDVGVIPGLANTTTWDLDLGDGVPAGGIYSSTRDLSRLGRAILNHQLIPSALTRRWFKRITPTADPTLSVGAPWEIVSLTEPRKIDLYTKAGDLAAYSAMMALSLDHNVGFTILGANTVTANPAVSALSDLVATILIPALDKAAKEEAHRRFSGTYTSSSSTGNSSMTITTDDGPGLKVVSWMNDSKDMLSALATLVVGASPSDVDVRLYPTGLESPGKISFRAVVASTADTGSTPGPFSGACKSWVMVDGLVYGRVGVDEFVFDVDEEGNAVHVSPRALRATLKKTYH